jgi:hypothetical protein
LIVQFSSSIAWCGLRPLHAPLRGHIAKSPLP